MATTVMLVCYGAIFLTGVATFLTADRQRKHVEHRMVDGDDRYFEEQRTYQTYPRLRNPVVIRRWGVFIMVGAIVLAGLNYVAMT